MPLRSPLVGLAAAALLAGCASTQILPNPADNIALQHAQYAVQGSMSYQNDVKGHDTWDTSCPKQGDCEDFALCKARKLIATGISPARMEIIDIQEDGQEHAVLVIDGKAVLDNMRTDIYATPSNGWAGVACNLGTGEAGLGIYTSRGLVVYRNAAMTKASGPDAMGPKCAKAVRELR